MTRLTLIGVAALVLALAGSAPSPAAAQSKAPPPMSHDDDPELQPPGPHGDGGWREPQEPPKDEERD